MPIYVISVKKKSMIAHAALVLKDAFAPHFASIQAILNNVGFSGNYEVILATFSSNCFYMLSLCCVHIL